jgi:excisionase family DNA binding protein
MATALASSPTTSSTTVFDTSLVPIGIDESPVSLQLLSILLEGSFMFVNAQNALITVPDTVKAAVREAIAALVAGPPDEDLSTQEAARLLGVSRPTLIRLLDSENIAYSVTPGQHRRVSRRALAEYRQRDIARRREALDELAASADDFGFFA